MHIDKSQDKHLGCKLSKKILTRFSENTVCICGFNTKYLHDPVGQKHLRTLVCLAVGKYY